MPGTVPVRLKKLIKKADKIAWLEATQIAGFTEAEASKFFGKPDPELIAAAALHRAHSMCARFHRPPRGPFVPDGGPMTVDPVELTAALVRCPRSRPRNALVLLEEMLSAAGFSCTRIDRGGISNLFARWGAQGANRSFGFNGHTDVVP